MALNHDVIGRAGAPEERRWSSKDSLLYALGVGCGTDDLAFTTENTTGVPQQALPTQAVVLGGGVGSVLRDLGDVNFARMVHGEESVTLHRPLPVEGAVRCTGRVTGIYDKGSGALVRMETEAVDLADGTPLFTLGMGLFFRGEGGFGGPRGPEGGPTRPAVGDGPADHVLRYQVREDQALLYRLSGDRNPLHSDPSYAALGGFDRPILHGLCTYGFTGRALLTALCDRDPTRLQAMEARFSSPVYPGDELTVSIWRTGEGEATFQTRRPGDVVVIDGGYCRFS